MEPMEPMGTHGSHGTHILKHGTQLNYLNSMTRAHFKVPLNYLEK